jgi:hypothetical protein
VFSSLRFFSAPQSAANMAEDGIAARLMSIHAMRLMRPLSL